MCLFKSCIRHQPLKMLEQDCRFVTRWKQMLILKKHKYWKNQNHSALLHMLNFQRHWWGFPGLCIQVSAQLFANKAEDCPTVWQHLRRWPNLLLTYALPNCLPALPKTTHLFANISEDGPNFCYHCPTVCHQCHTPANCLLALPNTDQLFANLLSLRSSN